MHEWSNSNDDTNLHPWYTRQQKSWLFFSNHKIKTHTSVIFASKLIPWGSNDDGGIGDGEDDSDEDDAENDDGDIDDGGDDEEGILLTSVMFASIFTPGVWNSLLWKSIGCNYSLSFIIDHTTVSSHN